MVWYMFRGKLTNHSKSKRKRLEMRYQGSIFQLFYVFDAQKFFLLYFSYLLPIDQLLQHGL